MDDADSTNPNAEEAPNSEFVGFAFSESKTNATLEDIGEGDTTVSRGLSVGGCRAKEFVTFLEEFVTLGQTSALKR